MKKFLAILMVLTMLLGTLAGCGKTEAPAETPTETPAETPAEEASKPVTLKLSHTNKEGGGTDLASKDFEAIVEAAEGSINIELYGNSQLGAESAVLESVMAGAVEIQVVSTSVLASVIPSCYVMNVPFLFDSVDQFFQIVNTEEFEAAFAPAFEKAGLKYLGFMNCNERAVSNNVRPIHTPEDMKGMNIRVLEGSVYTDLFSALGCATSIVAVTELYTALQQGMVDGEDCGISYIVPNGYAEVETYFTDTNHTVQPLCTVINLDKWNSLSAAQQEALVAAVREAGTMANDRYYDQLEGYYKSAVDDYGLELTFLTDEERQLFKDATASVADKYASYTPESEVLFGVIKDIQAGLK